MGSIQQVAKGGGCVSLDLSARATSPVVRRGRSEFENQQLLKNLSGWRH